MARATILIVENDLDYLNILEEALNKEDFKIIKAQTPDEAKKKLRRESIDIAIIDVRLIDDDESTDTTGLELAKQVGSLLPKIILTKYPEPDIASQALSINPETGLPAATSYIAKNQGVDAISLAIEQILDFYRPWMITVSRAVDGTNDFINQCYEVTIKQTKITHWFARIFSVLGILIVFAGITLLFCGNKNIASSTITIISGVIINVVMTLIYKQVGAANQWTHKYYQDQLSLNRYRILLQTREQLGTDHLRDEFLQKILDKTMDKWFGIDENQDEKSILASEKIKE